MNKHSETKRETYATLEDTISALFLLNPVKHGIQVDACSVDPLSGTFVLNFVTGNAWSRVPGRIYACGLGYHCVVVDGDVWHAPVVWNGLRAMSDIETNEELLDRFAKFVRETLWAR